jgi:hypothetical protein
MLLPQPILLIDVLNAGKLYTYHIFSPKQICDEINDSNETVTLHRSLLRNVTMPFVTHDD